jgi:hypothetical protein
LDCIECEKRARYSCDVPEEDKRETADALIGRVEQELSEKRQAWQRDREKQRTICLLSFSFLSLVILAALIALFLMLSRANEMRNERSSLPSGTASPSPQSAP